ncbi:MAG: hypothetical protein AB1918_16830, partial [Pseudomonadota bacterium]
VIVLKGTSEYCMAPKGDWRKFARRNLPEETEMAEAEAAQPWDGDTPAGSPPPVQEILPP